jgi:general secretion pathway protein G
MHPQHSTHRRGFTLVEILIVVIILGILAAIVIPQFSNTSRDARRNALTSTVQSVRSQIGLYKLQHGDTLPDLTGNWAAFVGVTVHDGKNYGPYMQTPPENPILNATAVKNGINVVAGDTCAFVYDYGVSGDGSGRFWGVDQELDGTLTLLGD